MAAIRPSEIGATKPPLACPFCGNALTKHTRSSEHVIPQWTHTLPTIADNYRLPENTGKRRDVFGVRTEHYGDHVVIAPELRPATRKSIHALNLTVPVCAACNNGWMSRLELRAKPYLEPLINGTSDEIPGEAADLVARWAVKTAYCFQQTDPPSAALTEPQRRDLVAERRVRWTAVAVARWDDPGEVMLIHGPTGVGFGSPTGTQVIYNGGRSAVGLGRVAFLLRSTDRPLETQGLADPEPPEPWRRLLPGRATRLADQQTSYGEVQPLFEMRAKGRMAADW